MLAATIHRKGVLDFEAKRDLSRLRNVLGWILPSPKLSGPSWTQLVVIALMLQLGLVAAEEREHGNEFVFALGVARLLSGTPVAACSTEYRLGRNWRGIHPYFAVHGVKGGAYYVGGGLLYHWVFSCAWRLTLSSGPGYYDRHHSPRDLGSTLEFYSNVELTRRLNGGSQIGLSFGHVSNGGFGNENPGSETLRLVFVRPFDRHRPERR
jgi:lipid A 3-O-deacylase